MKVRSARDAHVDGLAPGASGEGSSPSRGVASKDEVRAGITIVPVTLADANAHVAQFHRHHKPVIGHKFSIGAIDGNGELRGIAIIGRPVARHRDDGLTLEVTRCCTDGTPNTCSALYAAAWRAARAMGYRRIGTYTLVSEPGTSLRAAGWHAVHQVRGRSWDTPSRRRVDKHPTLDKQLWEPVG